MSTRGKPLDITQGVIWKQLLRFFFPILFGSLFQHLYSMADAVIVARFAGKEALAAVDSTASLVRLFINLFVGLSAGATILIAQQYGAKDDKAVSRTVHNAAAFALLGGGITMVLGMLCVPFGVSLMGVPAEIDGLAQTYLRIYFAGMIPSMIYNVGASILRAVGDAKRPLYFLIVGSLLNIVLDLLFVAVFGWGVAGAGIATVISQVLTAVLVVFALMRAEGSYRLFPRSIRMERETMGAILRVGTPIGLQSSLYPIANMLVQSRINRLGTDAIAAWAVCGKLDMIIWMMMDTFGITISTFVAQNYGAGHFDRARRGVRICIYIALLFILPLSAVLFFFGAPLSRLLIQDEAVVALCGELLHWYAPFFFIFIWTEVLSGTIRGTGETARPMLITLLGTCVLRILWVTLIAPLRPGMFMIVIAYPITWTVTALTYVIYYHFYAPKALPRRGEQAKAKAAAETAPIP